CRRAGRCSAPYCAGDGQGAVCVARTRRPVPAAGTRRDGAGHRASCRRVALHRTQPAFRRIFPHRASAGMEPGSACPATPDRPDRSTPAASAGAAGYARRSSAGIACPGTGVGQVHGRAAAPAPRRMGMLMRDSDHPVLVVASSRDDRRVLFDALDGMNSGEILSARDAIQAHALLKRSARPVLAILDFAHAPTQSRMLCEELAGVPVIGLFGADFDSGDNHGCPSSCGNVKAWLRVPVDATEAVMRVREALGGAAMRPPAARGDNPSAVPRPPREGRLDATLRMVADLLQPGRDAIGLPGLVQRAMQALGIELMVIAERSTSGDALQPLARMDRLSGPGASDPLAHPCVQQALDGEEIVRIDDAAASDDPLVRATACAWHAALPLFDAQRNVLGVMVCASRRTDAVAPESLQLLLQIVATRFAALLELRAERERGRSRALLDGLTGLPNRMLFNDRLESILHDARRTGEVFAVMFVDMDRFKGINDSLGHAVGDKVLVAGARRLREAVRASDTVARYAGDEFTLIIRHVNDRGDVDHVAAKLLKV